MNIMQLIENAAVANNLLQGKFCGFKGSNKESQSKQFSAKGNATTRLIVPTIKEKPFTGNKQFRPSSSRQRQGQKTHFPSKTVEERRALREAKKCYICEEGHFASECPRRNSQDKDVKSEHKGKKPKPNVGLVSDLVGDQQNVNVTELCRAWGKVRDQGVPVFFDPGARANFISPELASKLGIHAEEMGMTGEAVVAAVDLYQDFVPWCQRSTVMWQKDDALEAELEIGFKFLVERYISHVELKRPSLIKTSVSQSKLFEYLINVWEFKPGPKPGTCNLHFSVKFQFRSPLYRQVANMFFQEVVSRLVGSFEERCNRVYGPSTKIFENTQTA
ncbi:hypothetical protein L7F22_040052 [Adiantum nelumboides]|nr:hypothetical protein [Adiantum nelumboides]